MYETCKVNLCVPCAKDCSEHSFNNQKCAIGCADSQFSARTYDPRTHYLTAIDEIYIEHNTTALENLLSIVTSRQEDSISQRWTEASLRREIKQNVDFSQCHPLWKEYSIDIAPVGVKHEKTRQS